MDLTRFTRNASAAVVASIAGYASYWHQVAVATRAGERAELAHIVPLSVDGVLVVASIVMVDARHEGRYPHWVTRVGFGIGILASVSANIASALPTWLGRLRRRGQLSRFSSWLRCSHAGASSIPTRPSMRLQRRHLYSSKRRR